jgi:putative transposase
VLGRRAYVSNRVHCVFSTKERRNTIAPDKQTQLWSYLGGIARKNGFKAVAIGGIENHIHILLSIPATMPLAKAVQLLKGGSSKWMNDTGSGNFAWQEGCGAFTVGISQQVHMIAYINSQAEDHQKRTLRRNFLPFYRNLELNTI